MRRRRAAACAVLVALVVAGCGDDTDGDPATTTSAPTTIDRETTTTAGADGLTEASAVAIVTAFAEDVVGMVDPVVGPVTIREIAPAQASVEVRTRREGGGEDLTLTPTVVELVADGDLWAIESAASDHLTIESPPAGTRLSAGFVTPSGRSTAFEGTVVVQALLGPQVLGEAVATAEGIEDAPWSTRVETGIEAEGDGFILAFTTAGTELGAPVFALVPVLYGQ